MRDQLSNTDGELISLIQDALGTAETGAALVEVARNAHRAEARAAFIKTKIDQGDWQAAMIAVLDNNRPRWWAEWADQQDLQDYAVNYASEDKLRTRIALRLFHPILHAALEAGVVAQSEAKAP